MDVLRMAGGVEVVQTIVSNSVFLYTDLT